MAFGDGGAQAGPESVTGAGAGGGSLGVLPEKGELPAGLGGIQGIPAPLIIFPSTGCGPFCCSRRGACLSAFLMLVLAMLATLLAVATILGRPPRIPGQGGKREAWWLREMGALALPGFSLKWLEWFLMVQTQTPVHVWTQV